MFPIVYQNMSQKHDFNTSTVIKYVQIFTVLVTRNFTADLFFETKKRCLTEFPLEILLYPVIGTSNTIHPTMPVVMRSKA
jgi:hypothetical protein